MSYAKKAKQGYYGIAEFRTKDGKRHQKSAGCFKLKRQALAKADELEKELDQVNQDLADVSLADYYDRWFKLYKEQGLSRPTIARYLNIGHVLRHYFKDTRLRDIKRSDYQEFMNWYGANHAPVTVSKFNCAVRTCVNYAQDDDIVSKNFTNNVKPVSNKSRKRKVEYLTMKEIQLLKSAVLDGINRYKVSRYMIYLAIYTGMRKGEIQALTWNDIDFMHHTITINKSWDDVKKAFKPTKTVSSNRVIPVNSEVLNRLCDLKANHSTMIFRNRLGNIPTSTALNKCLRSIMSSAGIQKQGFHFHSLRHVHVAYLLAKGVDIYGISKRLGHANVSITQSIYAYLIDEYQAKNNTEIINKLAEL
ncbi:MAG TPA: site-specific integrase [Candidatus Limosilactobacillus merdigallinarum]|uniref:Site-specific integrase n=1 Tax=Candidatus Limosilactobacillus merdigallinarum TaxID=2838652 RepID=A0A9D1VID9_9LACO|nr:site-specific integrase [Candidatus Limosilactobacillus merdigallinarum]